jgi:hypothetical protein
MPISPSEYSMWTVSVSFTFTILAQSNSNPFPNVFIIWDQAGIIRFASEWEVTGTDSCRVATIARAGSFQIGPLTSAGVRKRIEEKDEFE